MLSSKTRAAVNYGWGLRKHPELSMKGPYGTLPTIHASRGGRILQTKVKRKRGKRVPVNYSLAALSGMGYDTAAMNGFGYDTAAMDGFGYDTAAMNGFGYDTAAMDGFGYDTAAMDGYGWDDILSTMTANIGPTAMATIEKLAQRLNTSIMKLISDPDKLIAILRRMAPKVGGLVRRFFQRFRNKPAKEGENTKNMKSQHRQYMQWLKTQDPEAYERLYKKMQKQAWDEFQQQRDMHFDMPETNSEGMSA